MALVIPTILSKAGKLKELNFAELLMLGFSLAIVPLLVLSLRLTNVAWAVKIVSFLSPNPGSKSTDARPSLFVMARVLNWYCRLFKIKNVCLPQSLALLWALRWLGVGSDLRIGVSRLNEVFDSHAWIEVNEVPVNDTGTLLAQYKVIHSYR